MHDSWDFHSSRFSCLQPLNLVSVDFMNECHDLSTSGCCWLSKTDVPGNCFFDAAAYEAGCTLPKCLGAGQNVSCLLTGSLCGSKSETPASPAYTLAQTHTVTWAHSFPLTLYLPFLTLHSRSHTVLLIFSCCLLLISHLRAPQSKTTQGTLRLFCRHSSHLSTLRSAWGFLIRFRYLSRQQISKNKIYF